MKIHLIRIICGILLILCVFLPWVSAFGINVSLFDGVRADLTNDTLAQIFEISIALGIAEILGIVVFFLLIFGGIITIFRGAIGGIVALIGMILYILAVIIRVGTLGGSVGDIIKFWSIGFYLGWIASIVALFSNRLRIPFGVALPHKEEAPKVKIRKAETRETSREAPMEGPPRPRPSPMPAAPKPSSAEPKKRAFEKSVSKRIERKLTFEQIESKVYRYLKRHRGELDVAKCAKRLGVSEEEVEKAAEALVAKGKLEKE